jgi:hypothetical protein
MKAVSGFQRLSGWMFSFSLDISDVPFQMLRVIKKIKVTDKLMLLKSENIAVWTRVEKGNVDIKGKSGHCTCISDFHKLKMGVSFEAITLGLETELMVAVWYRAADIKMRLESIMDRITEKQRKQLGKAAKVFKNKKNRT